MLKNFSLVRAANRGNGAARSVAPPRSGRTMLQEPKEKRVNESPNIWRMSFLREKKKSVLGRYADEM